MKIKFLTFLLIMLFYCTRAFAFVTFPTADLKIDKSNITVGDPVVATIDISVPSFVKLLQTEDDFVVEGWDIEDFYFEQDIRDEEKYKLIIKMTTYDCKLKEVPQIKLSFVNKNDIEKDSFFSEKFYFFSNSVPISVDSVLDEYDRDTMFDIKKMKKISVPTIFYFMCLLFVLFVSMYIYKDVVDFKIGKDLKVNFSPRENAIRKLNCIDINKVDDKTVVFYYCVLSETLKTYILDILFSNKPEFTTTEILDILSKKDNVFNKYYADISSLFKIYDNVKYSSSSINANTFDDAFTKTKNIIEKMSFDFEKNNMELK